MKPLSLFLSLVVLTLPLSLGAQTLDKLIDPRDDQVYKTVSYKIPTKGAKATQMTWMAENLRFKTEGAYCYEADKSNCGIMGRLYTWEAAMKACPQGWHLPNAKEWHTISNLFGGVSGTGKSLKSTRELWDKAIFWSVEKSGPEYAKTWELSKGGRYLSHKENKVTAGNSVRCVKD